MNLIDELKRRNVIRMAALYLVASWLLLQVGELLFDAFELPTWSMRLLIAFLALGFPLALVLSWVFELTPDGLKRDAETGSVQEKSTAGQRFGIAIAVLFALAVGIAAVDYLRPEVTTESQQAPVTALPERSIAVMPFVNMSDDAANEFFSDGLSEELLNLLARIPELRVSARTSSFSFKDKDVDIKTIGQQLNVANVLEGSVRKSGNNVRITAQLINANDGYHLWSATFDRSIDDIFSLQDEIAAEVVGALRVSILGEAPQARQTDPEAFSAYLQGRHFYQQRTSEGFARAVDYLRHATSIDPQYSPAWTMLSSTYMNQALTRQREFAEGHQLALSAIEQALESDPNNPYANAARGWLAMTYEQDYPTSAEFFNRALDLAPGDSAILGNYAVLVRTLGHVDAAIDLIERSLELNPVSSVHYVNLADNFLRAGRSVEAAAAAQKSLELSPGNVTAVVNLALSYLLNEQPDRAILEVEGSSVDLYRYYVTAMALSDLGRRDESDAVLAMLLDEFGDNYAFYIASVYAWRNEIDDAFVWLERAIDGRQPTLGIKTSPLLSVLWDDPRWDPLLESIGLSDEQIAAIDLRIQ